MPTNGAHASRKLEILRTVRSAGAPLTKKDLARHGSSSLPAVGRAVGELLDAGLLIDTGTGRSSGGRKPQLLSINPRLGYTVGLDFGGANIRAVASDLAGAVLAEVRRPAARVPDPLAEMEALVWRVADAGGLPREHLLGVGVAISGVIDSLTGLCRWCPNIPGFVNLPVVDYLQRRLGVPALIEDSLRGGALAERQFGVTRSIDDFLWVGVGIGVGTAVFLDGRLYRGVGGTAGELGHITVRDDGERCNCGNRGCLEVVASGPAVVERARRSIADGIHSSLADVVNSGQELTVEAIAQAARAGDKMAYYIIDRTGEYLGIAIAAALNLLGVPDVVIAGGVARAGSILMGAIERTTHIRVLPALSPRLRIHRSALDDLACARGVAWLAAEGLFTEECPPARSILAVAAGAARQPAV